MIVRLDRNVIRLESLIEGITNIILTDQKRIKIRREDVEIINFLQEILNPYIDEKENNLKYKYSDKSIIGNIDKYQIKIDTKRKQLGDFSKLVFNSECNKCGENKLFIENKMETEDDIQDNETIINTLISQIKKYDDMLTDSVEIQKKYNLFLSLNDKLNKKKSELSNENDKKYNIERDLNDLEKKIEILRLSPVQ